MPLSPVKPPPTVWPGASSRGLAVRGAPPAPPVRFGRSIPASAALQPKSAAPAHRPPPAPKCPPAVKVANGAPARVVQRAQQNPMALAVAKAGSAAAVPVTALTPLVDRLKRALALVTQGQKWLKEAGREISADGFEAFQAHYTKRANQLAAAAKNAEYSASTVGAFADFVVDAENTARLIRLANMAALNKDLTALARLRSVSKPLKAYIDGVILHEIAYSAAFKAPVTFADVTEHMRGYRFAGLHGSSSANGPSLYAGLKAPAASQVNYTNSQLGPGFYLTEGGTQALHSAYAKSVAELNVKKAGGSPYLYRVLLQNPPALTSSEVPQAHWNNMAHNAANPNLQQHMASNLMTAVIVDNHPARQIKVNANAFDKVVVMPPYAAGADADAWLKARFDPKQK